MNLIEFKQSADEQIAEVERLGPDINAILAFVGIEKEGAVDLANASEAINAMAQSAFSAGKTDVWERCRKLSHELVQRHVIEGEPLSPYVRLAESIRDQNRGGGAAPRGIEGDWTLAVKCAVASRKIWRLRGLVDQDEFMLIAYRTCEEGARAAKRLMAWGFAFDRRGGELRFEPESERRILAEIDRRVESFGGLAVARLVFGAIVGAYDPAQERHHIVRQPTRDGNGAPQAPIGYLLQLAAKHPLGRKPLRNAPQNWARILELATDYAAIMEVQPYVSERFLGRDAVAMFQALREIAIYDTLFCLPQLRPRDAVAIAEGILDGVVLPNTQESDWTLLDALQVARAIVENSAKKNGPQWVNVADIARRCPGMSLEMVSQIFNEVLSHPRTGANQRLLNPTFAELGGDELSNSGLDFFARPLLNLGAGRFALFDRSMCAPAFIEALLAPAERSIPNFGSALAGAGIERMLRKSFEDRGVKTKAGKYVVADQIFDCDLVVETADKVIFIEVKKKALTSKARSGFDVSVILDFANSALKAQTQAAGHELRLREGMTLELVDAEGAKHQVSLEGRDVERVAVSLPDFGSFQDRQVLMGFLHSQMDAEYSVNVDKLDAVKGAELLKDFKELSKLLSKFKAAEAKLHGMKPDSGAPFHHCWFLSVPQLLILLDEATDVESFWLALRSTRGIHMGTLDFYWEHAHFKAMKETVARDAASAALALKQDQPEIE